MTAKPWRWVNESVVLAIHDAQIAEHGGAPGIRDLGLIQSALGRAKSQAAYATPDAASLAAAYALGLVRNHGFIDGNKRTGFVVSLVFLLDNGYTPTASEPECLETMLSLAEGNISEAQLVAWFRNAIRPAQS